MTTTHEETELGETAMAAATLAALGHGSVLTRTCPHDLHLAVECKACAADDVDCRRWAFDLDLAEAGVSLRALRMTVSTDELPRVVETILKGAPA